LRPLLHRLPRLRPPLLWEQHAATRAFQVAQKRLRAQRTGFHCPWQNAIAERVIGTLRRELLDHLIPLNARHLQQTLTEYVDRYYNPARTHQSIERQTPLPLPGPPTPSVLTTPLDAEPVLGGLYHTYRRAA
jgi:transposase InsO family protein